MNPSMSTAVDVQGFLGEVEKALEQVLREGTRPAEQGETLVAAARHLCLGAGKRARFSRTSSCRCLAARRLSWS